MLAISRGFRPRGFLATATTVKPLADRRPCTAGKERIQQAETERIKRLHDLYVPRFEELSPSERSELAKSGNVWWEQSGIEEKVAAPLSANTLRDLELTRSLHKTVDPENYWDDNNTPVWRRFVNALTHHSCAIEGCKLDVNDTKYVIDRLHDSQIDLDSTVDSDLSKTLGMSEEDLDTPIIVSPTVDDVIHSLVAEGMPRTDVAMTIDHALALDFVRNTILGEKITIEMIVEVNHNVILHTDGVKPSTNLSVAGLGEDHQFRRGPVKVSGSPVVRPYPHELPAVMDKFLNTFEIARDLDPIIAAILFKMCFLHIHPFNDGNGRTARILMNAMLFDAGLYGCVIDRADRSVYMSFFNDFYDYGAVDGLYAFILARVRNHTRTLDEYYSQ